MKPIEEGVYYLFFKGSKNPRRCHVGIKYPGIEATPLITLGGRRSKEVYSYILQLLENNGVSHSIFEKGGKTFVELPLATGLATSIFLLAVYSSKKPLRYAPALEKMILGRMPMMKHLIATVEMALELNELKEGRVGSRQTLSREAANTASKILIKLIEATSR
jgi:hypothetical protein